MESCNTDSLSDSEDIVVLRRSWAQKPPFTQQTRPIPPCRFPRRLLSAVDELQPSFAMISGEIRNLIYQLLSSSIGTVTNNLDKKHSCSLLLVCSGTLGEYGDHFYATQREWRIMTPRVERGELHAPLMVQYLLSLPNIITFCIRRASPPSGEKLDNIITAYNATEKFPHYSRSKIQFETHFMIHCEPAISLYNRIGEMLGCIISNKPFATVVIDTTQMLCSDGCCPLLKALEMGSGWGKIRDMVGLRKRSILLRGAEGTRPRFSDSY